jgi:glucans biosynthesis protein C
MSQEQTAITGISPASPHRLFFIDNLRTALIILVILHHLAVIYGAGAPFYYVEPPVNDTLAYMVFLIFIVVNQAYFMGLLFLLSGYFSPKSFDHKGTKNFVVERIIRLGIPMVIFMFILGPLTAIGFWQMPASLTGITGQLSWDLYPGLILMVGVGPLWFLEMLLIFGFGYTLWRWATRKWEIKGIENLKTPGYLPIVIFIIILTALSYLIRMAIPLGQTIMGFPTLAYLPQYLSFFILGIAAYRLDWFKKIPDRMGIIGFIVAVVALVILLPLALTGHLFSLQITQITKNFAGLGNWESAVYALWDSIFSVGMSLALITFFRRFLDSQGAIRRIMARNSYTVYIFHATILVFLALGIKWIEIEHIIKWALAAVLAVPICFAVAFLVRKIPFLSRIL